MNDDIDLNPELHPCVGTYCGSGRMFDRHLRDCAFRERAGNMLRVQDVG